MEEMRSLGFPAVVITYKAAISAFDKGQQWESALRLLEEMSSTLISSARQG